MTAIFLATILLGISMLVVRMKGRPNPGTWFAILHGIFAVAALVIMIFIVANDASRTNHMTGPLILFCIAAVGGLIMFFGFHLRNKALPIGLMWAHGLLAVVAYLWMLI